MSLLRFAALAAIVIPLPMAGAAERTATRARPTTAERRNAERERILQTPVTWSFHGVSLEAWARAVSNTYRLPILIRRKALEAAGIGLETSVDANVSGARLGDAIRATLEPLELTWALADEAVHVTTIDDANSPLFLETRVYPVADLTRTSVRGRITYDFQRLADDLQENTGQPQPNWESEGGLGVIESHQQSRSLVISTTREAHQQIEARLTALRGGNRTRTRAPVVARPVDSLSDSIRRGEAIPLEIMP